MPNFSIEPVFVHAQIEWCIAKADESRRDDARGSGKRDRRFHISNTDDRGLESCRRRRGRLRYTRVAIGCHGCDRPAWRFQ